MARFLWVWLVAAVFVAKPTHGQSEESFTQPLMHHSVESGFKDLPLLLFTSLESKPQARRGIPILQTLQADPQVIAFVFRNKPERVSFDIFINGIAQRVRLERVNLFAPDFVVVTARQGPVPYEIGSYYVGTVQEKEGTLAAFSFFEKTVVGLLAFPTEQTLTVAPGDEQHNYWVYAEQFEDDGLPVLCHTEAASLPLESPSTEIREQKCVRLHYEVGYDIFQQCGSDATQTLNWMTALHNNVHAVFQIDAISTAISQIFIWDLPDPYNATSASGQLSLFRDHRPQLGGDLGQLLTMESGSLGGIAASLNGFCTLLYNYSYSDIEFAYEQVPLYSWTTHVILHEFGHLMGSPHTHNCSWPNGAIDGCAPLVGIPNEGNCPDGPLPENGGTIMSFCHLTQYGVNLALGFGEHPSQLMKSFISNASCLTPDCAPMVPAYCPSKGDTKWEWIQEAHFNDLSNISGPGGGYSDFTSLTVYAPAGSQVQFTLVPGYSGTKWEENFSIFIDFNGDKDFFDAGERVLDLLEVTTAVSGVFAIPANATGTTRLRLSMQFEEISDPCDLFKYGEVEDYLICFDVPLTYCASAGVNSTADYIDFFGWNNYMRESVSDGGYYFDPNAEITAVLGSETTVLYSAGGANTDMKYWKMWIDYNQDGDFDDSGEKIFGRKSSSKGMLARKFVVPPDASTGLTRMRLSMKRGSSPKSCEVFDYGEVEDYPITLLMPLPAQEQGSPSFVVYPNPAHRAITLEVAHAQQASQFTFQNLFGHVAWVVDAEAGMHRIQLNNVPLLPGVYLVQRKIPHMPPHIVRLVIF